MQMLYLIPILCIALCFAFEDTEESNESPEVQRNLQQLIHKLTRQQLEANQQIQSQLLSQLPLMRLPPAMGREYEDFQAGQFRYPPQSTYPGASAQSFASSSVGNSRSGAAGAAAYASVRDVDQEEQMAESASSPQRSTAGEYVKKSPTPVEMSSDSDESSKKTSPFALKHIQTDEIVKAEDSFSDVYFVAIVAGCCAIGIFGVISAGICFYRLQKSRKAAADVDYPAYGVTGPSKDVSSPNGDRKLAQSAQMYHYQHQKQQMIAVEKAGSTKNTSASDVDSEEENEEGDYTVYECPGLAPTGEMEVKNPLFHDDSTPVSPPVLPSKSDSNQN